MVFNSDGLNFGQNNHTKTKWVYLREMVQVSQDSEQREATFNITSGVKQPKQIFVYLQEPKKKLTKIVSSMNKAFESLIVDILNDKDPQVQLHQSKELTKHVLIGELNKNYGIKINIRLNITYMKQIEKVNVGFFKSNAREIINENDIKTVISMQVMNLLIE